MDKNFFDDSENSIIPPEGLSLSSSFKHSRPSELQYAYRHEIDLNQANKILSTGYFSVIFAVFISNLAFGLRGNPDGIALAISFVLLV